MMNITAITAIENEISNLYKEYENECADIAEQCAEEGYPSNGSNYDLRVGQLWDEYYRPEVEYLEERLEEERKHHLFVSFWDALPGKSQCLFNQVRNNMNPTIILGVDEYGFVDFID